MIEGNKRFQFVICSKDCSYQTLDLCAICFFGFYPVIVRKICTEPARHFWVIWH